MADEQTTAALRRAIETIEKKSKGLTPPLRGNQSSAGMRSQEGFAQSPEAPADPAITRGKPVSSRKSLRQTQLTSETSNQHAVRSNDQPEAVGDRLGPVDLALASGLLDQPDTAAIEAGHKASLRRAALNLLAQREQTAVELKQKLSRRFPDQTALFDGVIERLQEQGLQDDTRMAEAYVRYRVQRGQGPMKIRSEMMQKGLAGGDIDAALRRQAPDWIALATAVLQKRFGDWEESASLDRKDRAKRSRFLQQRGFNYEHISAAL